MDSAKSIRQSRADLQTATDTLKAIASANQAPEIADALGAAEAALVAAESVGSGECRDGDPPGDVFMVIENGHAVLKCTHKPAHTVRIG